MEKRFVAFLALAFAILLGNALLNAWLNPPQPPQQVADGDPQADDHDPAPEGLGDEKALPPLPDVGRPPEPGTAPVEEGTGEATTDEGPDEQDDRPVVAAQPPDEPAADPPVEEQWLALGSIDPESDYRMLVTFTNHGAAIHRLELSSRRFRDLDFRGGYLGHLAAESAGDGARVRVVGAGTPAAKSGVQVGDVITAINETSVTTGQDLERAVNAMEPGEEVLLQVVRGGAAPIPLPVTLTRRPLDVMRPEIENVAAREQKLSRRQPLPDDFRDPPSMLLTLAELGDSSLEDEQLKKLEELPGVNLRKANWEVADRSDTQVSFRRRLPAQGIEVIKRYRVATVPTEEHDNEVYPAYHLEFDVEIRNLATTAQKVAYQLDGPTGLPIEGWWYGSKISRSWGSVGIRDMVFRYLDQGPQMFGCGTIVEGSYDTLGQDQSIMYMGVDAKYFSAVLIPLKKSLADVWIHQARPMQFSGALTDDTNTQLANVSFRLSSQATSLEPNESLAHTYLLFAGPKRPDLLAAYHQPADEEYNLSPLIYYGWAIWAVFAKLMLGILHVLYAVVRNYGLAIILLTVLVRGAMFPLSRKQAMNMIKMQELQPEMKRIMEKYKKDLEKRSKAMQDLYRKHNYNPMGGCMVMFLQLPVFIGLYRGLMIDIELRQAPLLGDFIRWCSDLSAPDMLFDWSAFMPAFINSGVGIFGLGPYFNLLPVVTVVLFLLQQKMFTPPPADEQAAMQQKIMKYMMMFIGLMFYKVASGLCLYFIVSSGWGICERMVLPKPQPATPGGDTQVAKTAEPRTPAGSNGANGGGRRKSQKQKRK